MDLAGILSKKKEKKEYFWALTLEPGWVQAGIWTVTDGKVDVVSTSSASAWETEDELITSADTVLSAAASEIPEDAGEPSKTVFGVPTSWVKDGSIAEKYLGKIKHICTKLSLEPVGFVVLPEAISHYTKSKEGSPLSAVIIGVAPETVEISLFRLGNPAGNFTIVRSVSVVDDVVEGLSRFSASETLPSRFILYDGKEGELDDVRQSLMATNWNQYPNIKFLHTPKIEVVDPKNKVTATALAGGLEIANTTGLVLKGKSEDQKKDETSTEDENVTHVSPAAVGFLVGKDVAEVSVPKGDETPQDTLQQSVGGEKPIEEKPQEESGDVKAAEEISKKPSFVSKVKLTFASLASKFKRAPKSEVQQSGSDKSSKRILYIGVGVFAIFIIGLFAFWWFVPKATVTVYVSPKTLEEKFIINVDPDTKDANFETSTLPGDITSKTASGEKTISTTGTKTVGETAKGEVTMYRSGSEITLSEGTVLTGPNDLKFALNNDVTIASGSASTPGTAKVGVTAQDIGAQYNLASGEVFDVANYLKSDIEAKNESDFSGGSSREINAVSEEDAAQLEEDLTSELIEEAIQKIKDSLSDDDFLVEESITENVIERNFSSKVGEEATSLTLKETLEVDALVVNRTSLIEFSKGILKDEVPSSYVLREEQVTATFEVLGEDGGIYELEVTVQANLLPDVDPETIAKEIAGRYPTLAQQYLTSIDGFESAEIKMKPKLPGRLGNLPRLEKNITVVVAASK